MDLDGLSEDELWAASNEQGEDRGYVLHELSLRLFRRHAYEEAAATCETAASAFAAQARPLEEARSRYGHGAALYNLRRWEAAADVYLEAARLFRTAGSESDVAGALHNAADAFKDVGSYESALEHWASAIEFFTSAGDLESAATSGLARAELLGTLGRQRLALDEFRSARTLSRQAGNAAMVARADDRIAAVLIELGRTDDALDALKAAWHVAQVLNDTAHLAYARYRLGWTLTMNGRDDEALTHLSAARDLYQEADDLHGVAQCDLQTANAMSNLGRFDDAIELYERVSHLFDALGRDSDMLLAQANLAISYAKDGDNERAAEANARTVSRARELGHDYVRVGVATRLAGNLVDLGRPQEALDILENNPDARPEQENVLEPARRRAIQASALHAVGRSDEAAQEARGLIEALSGTSLHGELAEALETLSDTELAAGDHSAGERHRAQAIALYLAVGREDPARRLSQVFLHPDRSEFPK